MTFTYYAFLYLNGRCAFLNLFLYQHPMALISKFNQVKNNRKNAKLIAYLKFYLL